MYSLNILRDKIMSFKDSKIGSNVNSKISSELLLNIIPNKKKEKSGNKFEVSNLTVSTCTVITNLNSKVNLGYLTRFVNIYDQNADELNLKSGGIYNLEFYGNCARGETLIDRIKDEFNNQTTVKFKYWGFRNVNVKIFANGKLQMTGLKYENEAKEVGNLLIDIIKNTKINILSNINELVSIPKTFDLQVVYEPQSKKVFYYRKYYDRFLKNYNFDINSIYNEMQKKKQLPIKEESNKREQNIKLEKKKKNIIQIKEYSFNIKRKNFRKDVHDVYSDTIEEDNKDFLKENEWYGDNDIMNTIDKIELIKTLFEKDMEEILSTSKTLINLRENIEKLCNKYQDFKFDDLDEILNNINKNIYSTDEHTLVDIKSEIYKFIKEYRNLLEKKINRMVIIRNTDVSICNDLEKYLEKSIGTQTNILPHQTHVSPNVSSNVSPNVSPSLDILKDILKDISLETLDLLTGKITEPNNYFVNNITTVLINSDFAVNFNINLKKFSKILKKKGLFNTYEPDEHSGINLKYYYNITNIIQGFCNCKPHCATKEKHSICTKITILIFRPGSIIITGSRNLEQLRSAHQLILKIMEESMNLIKMEEQLDDGKNISLLNNEFRKISRKPRLFYIKKTNIVNDSL